MLLLLLFLLLLPLFLVVLLFIANDVFQIGLIGLVEEEWIDTLATLDPDDVIFLDYVEEGVRIARELKEQVN